MEIFLAKPTLEANEISPTESIPVKVLRYPTPDGSHKLQITGENLSQESDLENAVRVTGVVLGTTSTLTSTVGTTAVVFGSVFNADISSNLLKAI